jgi:DNA (cytosine-5)-methyltransferase 1
MGPAPPAPVMTKPRLLDLFSGPGGAAMGYARAGWEVVGVDVKHHRGYHFEVLIGDALEVGEAYGPLFDAVHASPPCQRYSAGTRAHSGRADLHPDLVGPTRDLLVALGKPYIIENVPGAPLRDPLTLCGTSFDLGAHDPKSGLNLYLRRHRLFESNVLLFGPGPCRCAEYRGRTGWICGGVYGGGSHSVDRARGIRRGGYTPSGDVMRAMMGMDWGGRAVTQAIPPAYTEHLGRQLLGALR